jgi:hypothetical protein
VNRSALNNTELVGIPIYVDFKVPILDKNYWVQDECGLVFLVIQVSNEVDIRIPWENQSISPKDLISSINSKFRNDND